MVDDSDDVDMTDGVSRAVMDGVSRAVMDGVSRAVMDGVSRAAMDGVSMTEGTERVGEGDSEGTIVSCRGLRRPGKQMMARYQWALKHGVGNITWVCYAVQFIFINIILY